MRKKLPSFVRDELQKDGAMGEGDRIVAAAKQAISTRGKGFAKDSKTAEEPSAETAAPESPVKDAIVEPAPVVEAPQIQIDQLAELVQGAVKVAVDDLRSQQASQLDELKTSHEAQLGELKTRLQEADQRAQEAEQNRLNLIKAFGLDTFKGNPVPVESTDMNAPMVNRFTSTKSDKPIGAVAEFLQIAEASAKTVRTSPRVGQMVSYDTRELDSYTRENRAQIIKDLDAWGKGIGFFRGSNTVTRDAATIVSNIPGGFLETLSSLMRTNNRPAFVFWQFPSYRFDFAARLGSTIDIPRAAYLPGPSDSSDRLLSGGGVFYPIDNSRQPLQTGFVQANMKEYGLGKDSVAPPVGIPTFVESYSMIELMQVLERNLMFDYYQWDDLRVIELLDQTSRVVYNDKNEVTTSAGAVVTGDDGTMTQDFLHATFGYMQELRIPTLPDGNYIYWLCPRARTQFKKSLGKDWSPATPDQQRALTEILNPGILSDTGRVSGYLGDYCNFHIFTSNNWAVSAGKGVQTETINSTSLTTRTSYAMGADVMGKGVGMPVEIRMENAGTFGRMESAIWVEHSDHVALDIDPTGFNDTSAVPQQLRVLEVHTLDVAI